MKNFILLVTLVSFNCLSQYRTAEGKAEVFNTENGPVLTIYDKAAQFLYNSLQVEAVKPMYSNSMIKTINNTECTQNEDNYFCIVSVQDKK